MTKYKIFYRLLLSLIALLLLVSVVFTFSHLVSEAIIKDNLESAAKRQLEYSVERLERDLKHIEMLNILLINDHSIKSYANSEEFTAYLDQLFQKKSIEEKLEIQRGVNSFFNDITIYWPQNQTVISTSQDAQYNADFLISSPKNKWFLTKADEQLTFHYLVSSPYSFQNHLQAVSTIVETTFTTEYLTTVLDSLDSSGNSHSFFYFNESTIMSNLPIEEEIVSYLNEHQSELAQPGPQVLELDGVKYSIQTSPSSMIGATLISYIKLDDFLLPLVKVKRLVYISLALLLITVLIMAWQLYKDLHFNTKQLVGGFEQLGQGNYGYRIAVKHNNEFGYLFNHFNNMAHKIQSLIENVYEEKIRARDAEYKHLQAQINPHFLYNCLFFIVSMANRSPAAVISMADNLAKYYRYITKKPGSRTTLLEELNFVDNYLKVQALRNKRLHYTINLPVKMNNLEIPPLSIQTVVENAIIHGIDKKREAGKLNIAGIVLPNSYQIIVEDDGNGLSTKERVQLTKKITEKMDIEMSGHGLWNSHQRIIHQYGAHSGLKFTPSPLGGLRVTIELLAESALHTNTE